ncbi:hypothetical protein BC940DRAFT_321252 [Gongronella butleri]|nr:hypothetical protein BC940DRAFT_321252 [Gongronella butleri]
MQRLQGIDFSHVEEIHRSAAQLEEIIGPVGYHQPTFLLLWPLRRSLCSLPNDDDNLCGDDYDWEPQYERRFWVLLLAKTKVVAMESPPATTTDEVQKKVSSKKKVTNEYNEMIKHERLRNQALAWAQLYTKKTQSGYGGVHDLLRFLGVFGKQAAGVDFRIPTSKATLFKWTGFDTIHDKSKTLSVQDMRHLTFGGLLCGEQLFESDQKTPKQVFFYEPLTVSIARMMIRPGFEKMINAWRNMPGDLGKWDVCHGNLWKNVPDPDYPPPGAFETGTPLIGRPTGLESRLERRLAAAT